MSDDQHLSPTQDNTIRVILPFKDQESANIVKKRLNNLSSKIQTTLRPVFVSRKLNQDLQVREAKLRLLLANNALCISLNVTCVMQGMLATPVGTCTSMWMVIKERRPPSTNTTRSNTMPWFLRT